MCQSLLCAASYGSIAPKTDPNLYGDWVSNWRDNDGEITDISAHVFEPEGKTFGVESVPKVV